MNANKLQKQLVCIKGMAMQSTQVFRETVTPYKRGDKWYYRQSRSELEFEVMNPDVLAMLQRDENRPPLRHCEEKETPPV